ncbi:MAG: iduronate sulfatase [Clostridium sp.]|uniref:iduronate sulfatase n=1 Tax=Clostridium sp. TaxID=1506 RepID=UPI0025B8373A|nr:iduronate sulfatase [Clostridium sp.]MCE5221053.1 iduronate sulfatase [Clostridium sp.]
MEQMITVIQNFGFPVACCIAMAYFIYIMWGRMNSTLDKITETNNQLVLTNQSLISSINSKVDTIEEKVDKIANKIG